MMSELSVGDSTVLRSGDIELCRRWSETGGSVLVASTSVESSSGKPALLRAELSCAENFDASWAALPRKISHRFDRLELTLADPGGVVLRNLCGIRLSVDQFLETAGAIAGTVSAMPARGVIHRDIAPENILLDEAANSAHMVGLGNAVLPRRKGKNGGSVSHLITTSLSY